MGDRPVNISDCAPSGRTVLVCDSCGREAVGWFPVLDDECPLCDGCVERLEEAFADDIAEALASIDGV